MNPDNYFDIWDIFANEIIGNVWLTIIIGLIIIYIVAAYFKLTYQVSIMIGILFLAVIAAITGDLLIWSMTVLAVGTLYFYMISAKIRKG